MFLASAGECHDLKGILLGKVDIIEMAMEQERVVEEVPSKPRHYESLEYSTITKNTYKHQLFCWIEEENTLKVMEFYENYPYFINKFVTFNNWSPAMFAVRYGNFRLLDYFVKNEHELDAINIYNNTVVHAACYANNSDMLIYLLKDLHRNPNPLNSDPSPLKFSIKTNNARMLEILACYGAYYIFDDIHNNVEKATVGEKVVYISLITKKEIPPSMFVKDTELKEFPIKEVLRWVRAKNFMIMKKGVETNTTPKAAPLARIFQNPEYMASILKYCVGSGKFLITPLVESSHVPSDNK